MTLDLCARMWSNYHDYNCAKIPTTPATPLHGGAPGGLLIQNLAMCGVFLLCAVATVKRVQREGQTPVISEHPSVLYWFGLTREYLGIPGSPELMRRTVITLADILCQ